MIPLFLIKNKKYKSFLKDNTDNYYHQKHLFEHFIISEIILKVISQFNLKNTVILLHWKRNKKIQHIKKSPIFNRARRKKKIIHGNQ